MPERYVLDELYSDTQAAEAHRQTPHYKNYLAKVPRWRSDRHLLSKPSRLLRR